MNINIKKRTYYICLNESINLSQFWNMSEKGDGMTPLPFRNPWEYVRKMSSKTMLKSRIHDNDVCLMRLSNGAHLPRLMWFRNA